MVESMSVSEVADVLGVTPEAIKKWVRELFPDSIRNGEKTFLTEEQITIIKMKMRPTTKVVGSKTELDKKIIVQQALKIMQEEIESLEKENSELKPKAIVYDKIADSSGLKTIQEIAALLNIGSKTFFDTLRRDGIFYVTGGTNLPKREHIEAGRFKVVEEPFKIGQVTNVYSRIFVTPKGELWLAQKYSNSNSHLLIEG